MWGVSIWPGTFGKFPYHAENRVLCSSRYKLSPKKKVFLKAIQSRDIPTCIHTVKITVQIYCISLRIRTAKIDQYSKIESHPNHHI